MDDDGLTGQARDALAAMWVGARWDYFLRFSWARGVDEITALAHLDRLRERLYGESRGSVLLTALHHAPYLHGHALWKLSRHQRGHLLNADAVRDWLRLRWPHGPVWCAPFDAKPDPRGTTLYVGRHPETAMW